MCFSIDINYIVSVQVTLSFYDIPDLPPSLAALYDSFHYPFRVDYSCSFPFLDIDNNTVLNTDQSLQQLGIWDPFEAIDDYLDEMNVPQQHRRLRQLEFITMQGTLDLTDVLFSYPDLTCIGWGRPFPMKIIVDLSEADLEKCIYNGQRRLFLNLNADW
jgi:hypothetical protein